MIMNKDYCFTFQNHNFESESTRIHNHVHNKEEENLSNDFNFSNRQTTVATYEVVPNDDDDDDDNYDGSEGVAYKISEEAIATSTNLAKNYSAREKLHLSLTTDKIALKSQHNEIIERKMLKNNNSTINKSMGMDVMQITNSRVLKTKNYNNNTNQHNNFKKNTFYTMQDKDSKQKRSQHGVSINFEIAPLENNKKIEDEEKHHLPEIVLTSFDTTHFNAILPTTSSSLKNENLNKKSNCVKFQGITQQPKVKIMSPLSKKTETSYSANTDAEDSSEVTSLPGNGNSTSPESLLDNVLSAASSVSVRSSSSLSSVNSDMTQLGVKQIPKKQPSAEIMPLVLIITPNEESNERISQISNNSIQEPTMLTWPTTKSKNQLYSDMSPMYTRLSTTPQLTPPTTYNSVSSIRTHQSRTPSPSASILLQQQQQQQINFDTSLYPDELKCKICLQIFQDPRTLNCLHSFCYQCIVNETINPDANISSWPHTANETNDCKGN